MFTPLKIDTSVFDQCVRELSRYSGVPQQKVVDAEFERVISAAIRFTPAAKASSIREYADAAWFSAQPPELYEPATAAGLRKRQIARRTKSGKLRYGLENKYPEQLWQAIAAARKASLQRRLKARGLAKRSWLRIARVLGLNPEAPGFVEKAKPRIGRDYPEDASAQRQSIHGRYGISARNAYPLIDVPAVNGRSALQRAINGRVKYFQDSLRTGVFSDLAKIAKRYPGIAAK